MRVSATVTPGAGDDADCAGFLNPLLRGEDKAVQARLKSNSVEFDGIKSRVVEPFPDAEELDGVAISKPVPNEIIRTFGIFETGDVRQTDEVLLFAGKDGDSRALDFNDGFLWSARAGTWIRNRHGNRSPANAARHENRSAMTRDRGNATHEHVLRFLHMSLRAFSF